MLHRKPMEMLLKEAERTGEGTLKRTLSAFNLTAIGIGMIIGAGLFSLTGFAAANYAGPAITISFAVAATACAFTGLCYAEFASMIPVSGSAYTYTFATMGELLAWIIGWDLVLEYTVGAATVAISWSEYLTRLLAYFKLGLPQQFCHSPFETVNVHGLQVHGVFNAPAVIVVLLITLVLIKGTSESALLNSLIVILKVSVVLVFIIVGWRYIDTKNYSPYIPANNGHFGEFGFSGIIRGAATIFFAFIGFDAVSTAGQEAKNPKRDLPIGILASLVICTVLYILFAHVLTGMVHYTDFKNTGAPVAIAIARTPYPWLQVSVIIAILAGFTSVILVDLMAQSRIFYTMSGDGLLPKLFSELHPLFRTPWKSNIILGIFVAAFAALVPLHVVGEMTSIGTLFTFILVCIGVWVLRKREPDRERNFRVPALGLVASLGIITCIGMMITLPAPTWIRFVVWFLIGIVIYFFYSRKHSKVRGMGK